MKNMKSTATRPSCGALEVTSIQRITPPVVIDVRGCDSYYMMNTTSGDYLIPSVTAKRLIDDLDFENPDGEVNGALGCRIQTYCKY